MLKHLSILYVSNKTGNLLLILLVVLLLHIIALRFFALNMLVPVAQQARVAVKLVTAKLIRAVDMTRTEAHKDRTPISVEEKSSTQQSIKDTTVSAAINQKDSVDATVKQTDLPGSEASPASPAETELSNAALMEQQHTPEAINQSSTSAPVPVAQAQLSDIDSHQAEGEPFSLPLPMRITYTAYINGVRNQTGSIDWQTDGTHYHLHVAIPLPFVGTFTYQSEGGFDAYGLAPVRYEEARGKRAPVATNFNRDERQTISFSRVTHTFPLQVAAQDRFSVLWQLIALVRGTPDQFSLGVTRVFYVADTDTVEEWQIQVVGEDDVPVQGEEGKWIRARHFLRLPRREGDERKLEVWLAESLGWIPVKIRQTEPSGNVLELLFLKSTSNQP